MSGHLGVGAVLPVTGDGAIDRPRVDGAHFLVARTQPAHDAGPESFHHHIRCFG